MNSLLISDSFNNLLDDCSLLLYLTESNLHSLFEFQKRIRSIGKYLRPQTIRDVETETKQYVQKISNIKKQIQSLQKELQGKQSEELLEKCIEKKYQLFDELRTVQGIIGSLVTSLDYQSPSFDTTTYSQAGTQTGQIVGTINDYKRDRHLDEQLYQQKFLDEYIDSRFKITTQVYAVNSGMAALTTIVNFLKLEKKDWGSVLLGKESYFENKEIITKTFGEKVIEIDETDTSSMIQIIALHKPSILFLDSLTNTSVIAIPNLVEIIKHLVKFTKRDTYLVIDNTGLSLTLQPFKLIPHLGKIHPIVFESLNKYHQFGMDRVTGGIIYARGKDTIKLFTYRNHLGTNITDSSIHAVPFPNKPLLIKKIKRHERNALFLAKSLEEYIDRNPKSPVEKIVYPGLPNHPSYEWNKNLSFHGSYFVIQWKSKHANVKTYQKFMDKVIKEARKKNVSIVAGSSFGLPITRIYLTALHSTIYGKPFLRISAGTETNMEIEKIKEVLLSCM